MNSDSQEEVRSVVSTPSLSDSLSQQIRVRIVFWLWDIQELNKKLLNLEQEKERYKSELEGVKLFFAEELQITDDKSVNSDYWEWVCRWVLVKWKLGSEDIEDEKKRGMRHELWNIIELLQNCLQVRV